MTGPPLGLRESKKRQTRQAIAEHAVRLFIVRGFEATTITEVADAARVAKKTVTNYFPRKEDLAVDLHGEFTDSLAETARGRAAGTPVLRALRDRHRADLEVRAVAAGFFDPGVARVIADSPTLTARLRELHEERERALAEGLGTLGTDGDLVGRIVAAHLATTHRILFQRVHELTLDGLPAPTVAGRVAEEAQRAFALLEPSFGDYGS